MLFKGDERNCGFLTRVYYRYATAAVITVDISRPNTFDSAKIWIADLNEKYEQKIPKILFINKCDLTQFQIDSKKIDAFCDEYELTGWYCISAKTGENIDESLQYLISEIMNSRSYEHDKSILSVKTIESGVKSIDLSNNSSISDCNSTKKKHNNKEVKKLSKMTFLTQIDSYVADSQSDNLRIHEKCYDCEENEGKCC